MTDQARAHCAESTGVHQSFATCDKLTEADRRKVKVLENKLRREIKRVATEDKAGKQKPRTAQIELMSTPCPQTARD